MKRSLVLGLVLAIAMGSIAVAAPADLPGGGWYSGQTIQNVGSGDAVVVVDAYDDTTVYTLDLATDAAPLAMGKSVTFFPNDAGFSPAIPDGFQGAAVVSADQPIKAVVNIANGKLGSLGVDGGYAVAQYQGIDGSDVDTTVVFPLVKNLYGVKSTTFAIQNAGTGVANITATYLMRTSLTDPTVVEYTQDLTIDGPGQMVILNPSAAVDGSSNAMPTGRIGSLTVTSDQPIAGVVLEHDDTQSPATLLQATRGFTPASYDSQLYVPVMKNRFGNRTTGLQVMNVSGGTIDIDVEYFPTLGTCTGIVPASRTSVGVGESVTFLQDGIPVGCLASAKVTATGDVVGVVNESFYPTVPAGKLQASTTYAAFPVSLATTKIAAPVFKERFGPKGTGLSVQNVGSGTATVTAEFTVDRSLGSTPSGSVFTAEFTINEGESLTLLDVNALAGLTWTAATALPIQNLCAVLITSDQPIVALANEFPWPVSSTSLQDKNNYEAFNLVP